MPYPHEHAARVESPGKFEKESFRRKNIAPGVDIIVGKKSGSNSMVTQAYRFDTKKFTAEQAKAWLKKNNVSYMSFTEATGKSADTQSFTVELVCKNIQALSRDEMIQIIPNETLKQIKSKDAYPTFSVYSICHEGISQPVRIDGSDANAYEPISWPRRAIQSIHSLKGIKCFHLHNEDNSTDNRKEYGEIVADCEREIDGILHHVAIAYHPPAVREQAKQFDVCSMEAVWNFVKGAGQWVADTLESMTGLALASSKSNRPAFLGARRLGLVQALDYTFEANKENSTVATLQEVKEFVKANAVIPSQLFTLEEIKKDGTFIPVFNEIGTKDTQIKTLGDQLKEAQEKVKGVERKELEFNAKTIFDKTLSSADLKLTDKQKTFITKKYDPSKIEDLSETGIATLVKKGMEEFKEYAQMFGDSKPIPQNRDIPDGVDMTTPENNDYLKD
jgi:hypothetical protein